MFTGIVEEIGQIRSITKANKSVLIDITATNVIQDTKLGDSISVNGVCLTVSRLGSNNFVADVMPETLDKTNLCTLKTGAVVNLERAMPSIGRFGGHIVSGHVDGVGTLVGSHVDDIAIWLQINANENIMKYIIQKGSVSLDGTSLTIAKLEKETFFVSLIPHTQKMSILGNKKVGETVNIECDIIGKYVERLLNTKANENTNIRENSTITSEFLRENGFL